MIFDARILFSTLGGELVIHVTLGTLPWNHWKYYISIDADERLRVFATFPPKNQPSRNTLFHLAVLDPEKQTFERLIFPTKYVILKSLKFSHWPSKATNHQETPPAPLNPPCGCLSSCL